MMEIATAIFAFCLALIAHAALCRLPLPGGALVKFIIAGGVIGLCLIIAFSSTSAPLPYVLAGMLLYGALCELYIFLFNSVLTSISANLLVYLSERDLTDEDIDRLYDSRAMVVQRIERLYAAGLAESSADVMRPTPKGVQLMATLSALRRFFHHAD